MNLWQFSGAPSDGQPVEIVFKSFQYQAYTETNNTQDNGSGNDTTDPPASDSNDTNTTAGFTTADYWVLHWYYIVGFFGVCFAMIGGFTRHWLVMLLGVVVIVFCYLYATSGGVLIGWLTGTGL
jgi:1,4-dihydroxy-2-naphthoate octaprenyltransferase